MDETQTPSIIGDDGELIVADPDINLTNYEPYEVPAFEEAGFVPERLALNERYPSLGIFVIIGLFICGLLGLAFIVSPKETPPTLSQPKVWASQLSLPKAGSISLSPKNLWQDIQQIQWSADGREIGVRTAANRLYVWNFNLQQLITHQSVAAQAFDWKSRLNSFVTSMLGYVEIYLDAGGSGLSSRSLKIDSLDGRFPLLLKFSSDGNQLAIGDGNWLRVVDAQTGKTLHLLNFPDRIMNVLWASNNQRLYLVVGHKLYFWEGDKPQEIPVPAVSWLNIDLSSDGKSMVLACDTLDNDQLSARIGTLNVNNNVFFWSSIVPSTDASHPVMVALAKNGIYLASFVQGENRITLWDRNSMHVLQTLTNQDDEAVTSIDWSPDSHYLAFSSSSYVTIWNSE